MRNDYLNDLKNETNYGYTENGAIKHNSTMNAILDMFGMGGAFRKRSDSDCITLFSNAFAEDKTIALKCLFYLRDVRGGQGERRFFRVCYKWLCNNHQEVARKNLIHISEYGRWDDLLYSTYETPLFVDALKIIKSQLALDVTCKTPSLLAKWLPSENASAQTTKELGNEIRKYLGFTHKEYRKILSALRTKINIVEKLMSENRWDEIEFDKIPSKAGLIYKNAFARRDIIMKKYETFAKSKDTKVNAEVLNPVDIADKIGIYSWYQKDFSEVDRAMFDKYWDNLKDYYNGREENGIAIVDTSGSMSGQPMNAAVSMGAYIAERGHGPFANHFITFSSRPELVKFHGADIVDKFRNATRASWGMNTNIEAVFDLLLNTAIKNNTPQEDMPERLYIFSDMEFDNCVRSRNGYVHSLNQINTLLEDIAEQWQRRGYELPKVIFWNLDARSNNIPALGDRFSYVSGFSMNMVEQILSGETGVTLMLKKLLSERYLVIEA